jgi:RNA polymerase sigma-70 factor, ECF subfamily
LTGRIATWQRKPALHVLVARPEPGPQASFQDLARKLEPFLYATALRLCGGNASDARDLVQDTLERGLQRIEQLPAGSNVRGWLGTILHNRFIDMCRTRSRVPVEALDEKAADTLAQEEPAEAAWEKVSAEDLRGAMDKLEDDLRQVCQLHGLERRPYKEIAHRLGIPIGTVGTRLIRARSRLRSLLGGPQEEPA